MAITKQDRNLAMLSAMNQAQQQQFMAATLLAVAVIMKKTGLTEISITPEEVGALLKPGETLEPVPLLGGGFSYKFVQALPPLAKKPVPSKVKKAVKSRAAGAVKP